MELDQGFTLHYVSTFTPDRIYLALAVTHELYLAKIGGQTGVAEGFENSLLFPLGWWMRQRGERLRAKALEAIERATPDEVVRLHRHNRRLGAEDIQQAVIEPPSRIQAHGPHLARLTVQTYTQGTWRFQIEDPQSLANALEHLPRAFGTTLDVQLAPPPVD